MRCRTESISVIQLTSKLKRVPLQPSSQVVGCGFRYRVVLPNCRIGPSPLMLISRRPASSCRSVLPTRFQQPFSFCDAGTEHHNQEASNLRLRPPAACCILLPAAVAAATRMREPRQRHGRHAPETRPWTECCFQERRPSPECVTSIAPRWSHTCAERQVHSCVCTRARAPRQARRGTDEHEQATGSAALTSD